VKACSDMGSCSRKWLGLGSGLMQVNAHHVQPNVVRRAAQREGLLGHGLVQQEVVAVRARHLRKGGI
jgi:hypothetical protein